jgi:osmotically-inducible protein OsmY
MFHKLSTLVVALAMCPAVIWAGPPLKDQRILDDVAASVNACPHFTIFDDVAVHVRDGVVTLTGKVTMGHKRDEIGKRLSAIPGVRQVIDQITVLPASSFDDELRQRISRAIYGNSNFWNYAVMPSPPIHIIVERSHVTLTGIVRSEVDRRLAQALATQFGALSVTNALRTDQEMVERRDASD